MNVQQKYEQCLRITSEALDQLEVKQKNRVSDAYLEFTKNYIHDAKHYALKGDYVTALEAIAYAHGFIDAGVLAGFFKIEEYHLKSV
ncbi:DUF357 domain-containing protein [archaeon]|nr:DUF357 domain-containing protein [archaeon]